ncbi:MAG: STAS domain-containing protein [Deltaproteobacteria bacterium]|nr:STAS domain-containing protein [Deltaproteobacteria bacterium]
MRVPIISLYGTLIASIQFDLSDELLFRLKEDIGQKIDTAGAKGLILDLSGIEVMDSYITRGISDLAQMARLMGVETVVCGLQPAVAGALVDLGLGLRGILTALDLELALELVQEQTKERELVWESP